MQFQNPGSNFTCHNLSSYHRSHYLGEKNYTLHAEILQLHVAGRAYSGNFSQNSGKEQDSELLKDQFLTALVRIRKHPQKTVTGKEI